ncbi:hypothetical protein QJS66_07415 [Kocuria rhizophila]|nr:hypothetical protein QJS66_07415 [Kocuria rhizophila]
MFNVGICTYQLTGPRVGEPVMEESGPVGVSQLTAYHSEGATRRRSANSSAQPLAHPRCNAITCAPRHGHPEPDVALAAPVSGPPGAGRPHGSSPRRGIARARHVQHPAGGRGRL